MRSLYFLILGILWTTATLATPVDCSPSGINAGSIAFPGAYNPNVTNIITSVTPASSKVGQTPVEYIWIKSLVNVPNTSGNPYWSVVQGSLNLEEIAVPPITQTTYFMRCARLVGCKTYWGETSSVEVGVDLCGPDFINGGSISFSGSYNPNTTNVINNVEAGSSDFGSELGIEYIWLQSAVNTPNTVGNPHWSVVPGSQNQLELTLGELVSTTYFIRCARPIGCPKYWGETNIVEVPVDPCLEGSIAGGSIEFNGSYNPVEPNLITNAAFPSGPFEGLGFEYIWLQSEVNVPNTVGNPYWSVVPGSLNMLELEVSSLTQTIYYIRCARYIGCQNYWGESN
ncbi:MAG: hypothetical protein RIA63_04590, partial [Cyclobacteriaceae bacterium]